MTTWIITGLLVAIIARVVYAEIRHGRRTKNFLEHISPEIEALNDSVTRKYRAKYGKDPTLQFPRIEVDGKKS